MFIPNFSEIVAPITKLFGKDVDFTWGPEQQAMQEELIYHVTHTLVLVRPDLSRQFELEVDASKIATGGILYQHNKSITLPNGKEKPGLRHPLGFTSHKFSNTEQNYPIYNHKFLAIMCRLYAWSHLLKETKIPILVFTDHANLCYYHDTRKIG